MILITGGSGSGKSAYGEKRILEAGDMTRYYIATMEVFGEEGRKKVERHKRLRQGKGFITIESPKEVGRREVLDQISCGNQEDAGCIKDAQNAKKAVQKSGVEPQVIPVRGGTDGARLSFMGLPCPNLGTGSYACHGPYEHATAEGMDIVVDTLTELVRLYGEMK